MERLFRCRGAMHLPFPTLQAKAIDRLTGDELLFSPGSDDVRTRHAEMKGSVNGASECLNGRQVLSAEDSRYSCGRIGLMSYAEQHVYDNVFASLAKWVVKRAISLCCVCDCRYINNNEGRFKCPSAGVVALAASTKDFLNKLS